MRHYSIREGHAGHAITVGLISVQRGRQLRLACGSTVWQGAAGAVSLGRWLAGTGGSRRAGRRRQPWRRPRAEDSAGSWLRASSQEQPELVRTRDAPKEGVILRSQIAIARPNLGAIGTPPEQAHIAISCNESTFLPSASLSCPFPPRRSLSPRPPARPPRGCLSRTPWASHVSHLRPHRLLSQDHR